MCDMTGSVPQGRAVSVAADMAAAAGGRLRMDAEVLPHFGQEVGGGGNQPNHSHPPSEPAAGNPAVVVRPLLRLRRRVPQLAESLRGLVAKKIHPALRRCGILLHPVQRLGKINSWLEFIPEH